jgi:hypothetical protein
MPPILLSTAARFRHLQSALAGLEALPPRAGTTRRADLRRGKFPALRLWRSGRQDAGFLSQRNASLRPAGPSLPRSPVRPFFVAPKSGGAVHTRTRAADPTTTPVANSLAPTTPALPAGLVRSPSVRPLEALCRGSWGNCPRGSPRHRLPLVALMPQWRHRQNAGASSPNAVLKRQAAACP